jgi:uracil phosphoribosyltransferase
MLRRKMTKIFNHPLINHKLTIMRDETTSYSVFKRNLNEISSLMVYEVLKDFPTKLKKVKTPTGSIASGAELSEELIIVPILRAGIGMVDGIHDLVPEARVGHIGLYRDEKTFKAKEYFYKMPAVDKKTLIIVVDPMLATGVSASDAISHLKKDGFSNIKLVCLVGVQAGLDKLNEKHSDVDVFLAAKDEYLNDKKYIIPGLGDAGDRIFGTK